MIVRKTILGAAFLASLSAGTAFAGGELYPVIEAPEVDMSTVAVAQGWYIRGDLGYAASIKGGDGSYNYIGEGGADESRERFDDARFSKPFSYGVGMGYQFNNFVRTDLTTDFFNSSFDADSSIGRACPGENAGTGCDFTHESGFNAISVMANGYIDLGTYAGFTPYIGGGVGATNVQWDDLKTRATCVDGTGACGSTEQGDVVRNPGEESWRFTYALMAGASYDLTNRIKLDIGYRYSDVDGGKMFGYSSAEKALGASGTKARDDGFQRHEIRAGIRVTTW
ncbi:opacity protein-like surface antigen [Rhizobium subbaraonis]|uniref:Opacity protein-like surface antigen n=1 Tax=Rhizobium subbaraonis TaxID=908946 RepID=A0A285U903_9HYPH|nr:outer membrane protein [Rhizobium subbaraonis]SOC37016.1 opacity protein-like surface antigen [Rhizobium subbaraonis]